jgi:hypothetical protein
VRGDAIVDMRTHRGRMEPRTDADSARKQIYDVVLACEPPESLRHRFPNMWVRGPETHTALRRRVSGPARLDDLLEKLAGLGLPLVELHRLPGATAEQQTYEVRVEGELGEPLLRYLSWPHQVVSGQTRVRITAATVELHRFLRACTECGASIQRVRLVTPVLQPQVV